jgi:hypothetical protein
MIAFYALGGGLGHLTRCRAVHHTLGLGKDDEAVGVLVSSSHGLDRRVLGDWEPVPAPAMPPGVPGASGVLGGWAAAALQRLGPRTIFVDAFPGGIYGELCVAGGGDSFPWPPGAERFHVARRLRWTEYRRRLTGPLPTYRRTFVVEPLEPEHRAVLAACSEALEDLDVTDPPPPLVVPFALGAPDLIAEAWLVVHSGPEVEIRELVAYAMDLCRQERASAIPPPMVLVSPLRPPGLPAAVEHLDLYPAWPLFAVASRIVTAGGWNLMRQTLPHAAKHRFLPFPRPLDDQFYRAAARRLLA